LKPVRKGQLVDHARATWQGLAGVAGRRIDLPLWSFSKKSARQSDSRKESGSVKVWKFVSRDLDLWAYQSDVARDLSRPGKPTDNAFELIDQSVADIVAKVF
jgi:hypothetical protein